MWKQIMLVINLAACGGDTPANPDGAVDGPPDSLVSCASSTPPGEITVHAKSGREIVFHDSGGSVLGRATVGASGETTGMVTACGAVTLVFAATMSNSPLLYTVTDVEPGEVISFVSTPIDFSPSSHHMAISSDPVTSGTVSLTAGCGPVDATASVPAGSEPGTTCRSANGTVDVLGLVVDVVGNRERPVAYSILPDLAVPAVGDGSGALPPWRTDLATTTFELRNVPAFADYPSASVSLVTGKTSEGCPGCGASAPGAAGSADLETIHPPGFGDGLEHVIVLQPGGPSPFNHWARRFDATLPATLAIDVTSEFVPEIIAAAQTTGARPTISWTLSRPVTNADAIVVWGEFADNARWGIVTRANATSVRAPEVPADLLLPELPNPVPDIELFELSDVADYTAARRSSFHLFSTFPDQRVFPSGFKADVSIFGQAASIAD